jgi:hypothetical protein
MDTEEGMKRLQEILGSREGHLAWQIVSTCPTPSGPQPDTDLPDLFRLCRFLNIDPSRQIRSKVQHYGWITSEGACHPQTIPFAGPVLTRRRALIAAP